MDLLDGLILFTAGKAVYVYISVDSTHRRFNRVLVEVSSTKASTNGKRAGKNAAPEGKKWIADTCKHHALITPDGVVLASDMRIDSIFLKRHNAGLSREKYWNLQQSTMASIVTDRNTADSTVFEKLCANMPEGSGPALGDSAYCSSDNCEAAIAKGRDPYFEPKKNHAGRGTSNRAKMVRLWKEHPGRFYKVYKARTTRGRILCHQGPVCIPRTVSDPPHAGA